MSTFEADWAVLPFPTELHRDAAQAVTRFLAQDRRVQAVLLTCSCARGCAVPESCVDLCVLCAPEDRGSLELELWPKAEAFISEDAACRALAAVVPWSAVDLDFRDGIFRPGYHGWTSGPDNFELEIGNCIAYAVPLFLRGSRFDELRREYLPFYDENLRQERLREAIRYMRNNIEHVGPYARRGLLLGALDRLLLAFREFLQALFISRRVYPVDYMKWVEQQVGDLLGLPELAARLHEVLSIPEINAVNLQARADTLNSLAGEYLPRAQ